MPRKFLLRQLPKPDTLLNHKALRGIKHWLDDTNLWHMNRHSVSWGVACGLFMAFIPIPMQMFFSCLLAIVFRGNIPIAFSTVWITNPVTIPPIFYLSYQIGAFLLDTPAESFHFELSLRWLFEELGYRWKPFLLGCFTLAFVSAFIGYLSVKWAWRYHIIQKLGKKRKELAKKILSK